MIRGFNVNKGVDYFDTYSPVTKTTIIRTLIALASIHDLVVHQMDVKNCISKWSFRARDLYDSIRGFCGSKTRG